MQLSYDSRGNSVPTILLLMQRHLYNERGLQEGIFRINADNSREKSVREQLNKGVIPEGVDIHCLAGLIKAWFRELPTGILDSLAPAEVIQTQTEEDFVELVRRLPLTEASLLDWGINLMSDVVQQEHVNKMNAHNIAMVFAPNMTQIADPLNALIYAVQVMNFLKTLILKTLREREDPIAELPPDSCSGQNGYNGPHGPSQPYGKHVESDNEETEHFFDAGSSQNITVADVDDRHMMASVEKHVSYGVNTGKSKIEQSNFNKWSKKSPVLELPGSADKEAKGSAI